MIDIAIAYQRYKFIGLEFLTWMWFTMETDPSTFQKIDSELISCQIGKRLVLENRRKDQFETVTIKGDAPGLEEARTALKKGAMVAEMDLSFKKAQHTWEYSIKGENLSVSAFRLPTIRMDSSMEGMDDAIHERLRLVEKAVNFINTLFHRFIKTRISRDWDQRVLPDVHQWITSQGF